MKNMNELVMGLSENLFEELCTPSPCLNRVLDPQWPNGLAGLASNHRLSCLLVRLPEVGMLRTLSQYDPGCQMSCKARTLTSS